MKRSLPLRADLRTRLIVFAAIAVFAPALLSPTPALPWLPAWLGALVAFAALCALLWTCRKAGLISVPVLATSALVCGFLLLGYALRF